MTASRVLALALLAACWAMTAFSLTAVALPRTQAVPDAPGMADVLLFTTGLLSFPGVGALIASRRPESPVGWLLLVIGLSITTAIFSTEYTKVALYDGAPLPAVPIVASLGWSWIVGSGIALPLLLLLYPDGRPPGTRWRLAAIVGSGITGALAFLGALAPGPLAGFEISIANPFGVDALAEAAEAATAGSTVALVAMAALGVAGMAVKFRRSRGVQRQQFKWLVPPAVMFLGGLAGAAVGGDASPAWTVALLGMLTTPAAIGIAILRHRLFDIDLVIRRSITYAVVVALLGTVYAGLVLVLQGALTGVTGNETLPVALSTLVIAALFGPVRRRVRGAIDGRFYRARYDAHLTLEAFAARLRDEIEPQAVGASLVGVAQNAVRPSAASLWIRHRGAR